MFYLKLSGKAKLNLTMKMMNKIYGCRLTHPANYKTTYVKISELKGVHPFIDRLADN